jgi:hypothetical protein
VPQKKIPREVGCGFSFVLINSRYILIISVYDYFFVSLSSMIITTSASSAASTTTTTTATTSTTTTATTTSAVLTSSSSDGLPTRRRQSHKSRLLQFSSNRGFVLVLRGIKKVTYQHLEVLIFSNSNYPYCSLLNYDTVMSGRYLPSLGVSCFLRNVGNHLPDYTQRHNQEHRNCLFRIPHVLHGLVSLL